MAFNLEMMHGKDYNNLRHRCYHTLLGHKLQVLF